MVALRLCLPGKQLPVPESIHPAEEVKSGQTMPLRAQVS